MARGGSAARFIRRSSVQTRLLALLAVGIILVVAGELGWLGPVRAGAAWLTSPFQSWTSGVGNTVGGWFSVVGSAGQLAQQNAQLQAQVAALQQQLSQDTEIKAQNDQLRQQLGVGPVRPQNLVAAEVIGYQPDNFRQFITIGRGTKDGIANGMPVVYQGRLVGTVQEATPTSAKVFLVVDPNFRLAAIDQDEPNRPSGIVRGQLGGGMLMDEVAQTDTLKPGDSVITSGLGSEVPKGIIVGHIQSVNKSDNGVFQSAEVTTDVPFSKLEVVFVVTKS
jgi:rod shape-determining protein MreC